MVILDADCDGFSSSAILINYIFRAFPDFPPEKLEYFMHDGKQHGIEMEKIPLDMKLLIIPDASSNDNEQVAQLNELGVDVIILDHHLSDCPPKYAKIVNNQLCDYPNKTLSGAGIVWKFIKYLDSILNIDYADYYLDLAMTGIVGDVMLLNEYETRYIIKEGLSHINNPFLSAMIKRQAYSLKNDVTPDGIAFYVVPYINAVVRMGTLDEKFTIFESMLDVMGHKKILSNKRGHKENELETLAERAVRVSNTVKNRQQKLRDKEVENLEAIIERDNMLDNKVLIFCLEDDERIDKNLSGLIANVIMGKFNRPVLILNYYKDRDEYSGSGRAPSHCGFDNFKDFLSESGLVVYAAGHQSAFGTSIKKDNKETLINYCNEKLKDIEFSNIYNVDFIFDKNELTKEIIFEIADGKQFYGQGIEEPYIAIENIVANSDSVKLLSPDKNPTIRIDVGDIAFIKFKATKEEYEALTEGNNILNIVGRCEINVWNGNSYP